MPKEPVLIEPINATLDQVSTAIFSKTKIAKRKLNSTHEGVLPLANIVLNVAVLNDGTRVISQAGVFKAFGRTKRGRAKDDIRVLNRPAFLDAKNLQPYINQGLEGVLNTIVYTAKNGSTVEGYNAEILPKICEVYLDVRARR